LVFVEGNGFDFVVFVSGFMECISRLVSLNSVGFQIAAEDVDSALGVCASIGVGDVGQRIDARNTYLC